MDEREGEKEKEGGRERGNKPNLQPCRYMALKGKTDFVSDLLKS